MRLAMFAGMEKPMPTLPPERERMALLMPTTSPLLVTSGPAAARGCGAREPPRVDDAAGAEAPLLLLALGGLAEEAAEELLAEVLLDGRPPQRAARHGVDVDHRGGHRLGDLGEAPGRHRQGGRDHAGLHARGQNAERLPHVGRFGPPRDGAGPERRGA